MAYIKMNLLNLHCLSPAVLHTSAQFHATSAVNSMGYDMSSAAGICVEDEPIPIPISIFRKRERQGFNFEPNSLPIRIHVGANEIGRSAPDNPRKLIAYLNICSAIAATRNIQGKSENILIHLLPIGYFARFLNSPDDRIKSMDYVHRAYAYWAVKHQISLNTDGIETLYLDFMLGVLMNGEWHATVVSPGERSSDLGIDAGDIVEHFTHARGFDGITVEKRKGHEVVISPDGSLSVSES